VETYTTWVGENPFLSAFVQFAVLGTLGEMIPALFRSRSLPCTKPELLGKVLAWGLLDLFVQVGFIMVKGGTHALQGAGVLPEVCASGIGWAFAVSVLTNTFFGPQLMVFHRLEDNLILRERNWRGLDRALWTLLWFWIPAHTLTFSLPRDYQIGLAALWSVVLGVILGMALGRGKR